MLNEKGDLVTVGSEKAKLLNAFFASVFTSNSGLQKSHVPEASLKDWCIEYVILVEQNQVRDYLRKLGIYKSIRPVGSAEGSGK